MKKKRSYGLSIFILALIILLFSIYAIRQKMVENNIIEQNIKSPLLLDLEDEMEFDGNTTFLKFDADYNKNNEISIGFWIKPTERKNSFVMSNGPSDGEPSLYVIYEISKRIKFNRGKSSRYTKENSIPLNEWTYVFITNDGSITKFYINGELEGTFEQNYEKNENHREFYIGKGYSCSSIGSTFRCSEDYFRGSMKNIKIYDEVIDNEEILVIYENTKL